jgi:sugar phosphate isomerase/epimerase
MKIACSSASFAPSIESGALTQLEWLDACANELEIDGVVFAREHFPRTDAEYLAQLKKTSVDLGLTIAAVACDASLWNAPSHEAIAVATALGSPLLVAPAPAANDDSETWGAFADAVKEHSRAAKTHNVTLAIRNAPETLCHDGAALRRLAKDVDSAWLRYAPDLSTLATDDAGPLLPKSVIAIARLEDAGATTRLERFRGFIWLETSAVTESREGYHHRLEAFRQARLLALAAP